MRFWALLLVLLPLLTAPQAVDAQQKDKARKQKSKDADADITAAEAEILGYEYYNGENGKKVDYASAVYFYNIAAKKNSAVAQNNLGNCYFMVTA